MSPAEVDREFRRLQLELAAEVFYREAADTLDVIGIPHHWMHFDRHLERLQLRQR
ncbi:TPA: hypothetical protein ACUNF5_006524 [Burkholderia orbicola]|uniref:hypothetical protein n=1 Tax=Burkholderia orbicola TaxID=2978683 RepID=UPI00264B64ED|nr:hypothetical protein [Burkholderia orbicola]MDN7533941.1 hypothetical protein [Burkholderia orbicola]